MTNSRKVRGWATTSRQNSFNNPWHTLYKSLEVYWSNEHHSSLSWCLGERSKIVTPKTPIQRAAVKSTDQEEEDEHHTWRHSCTISTKTAWKLKRKGNDSVHLHFLPLRFIKVTLANHGGVTRRGNQTKRMRKWSLNWRLASVALIGREHRNTILDSWPWMAVSLRRPKVTICPLILSHTVPGGNILLEHSKSLKLYS